MRPDEEHPEGSRHLHRWLVRSGPGSRTQTWGRPRPRDATSSCTATRSPSSRVPRTERWWQRRVVDQDWFSREVQADRKRFAGSNASLSGCQVLQEYPSDCLSRQKADTTHILSYSFHSRGRIDFFRSCWVFGLSSSSAPSSTSETVAMPFPTQHPDTPFVAFLRAQIYIYIYPRSRTTIVLIAYTEQPLFH